MTKVTLICTLCILAALFITKRKELPIYECYSPMMGKAQCDLDTKLSDERDVGSRRMLDIFRECKTLFVQGEAESMSRFMQRIPADSSRLAKVWAGPAKRDRYFYAQDQGICNNYRRFP